MKSSYLKRSLTNLAGVIGLVVLVVSGILWIRSYYWYDRIKLRVFGNMTVSSGGGAVHFQQYNTGEWAEYPQKIKSRESVMNRYDVESDRSLAGIHYIKARPPHLALNISEDTGDRYVVWIVPYWLVIIIIAIWNCIFIRGMKTAKRGFDVLPAREKSGL